MTLTRVANKRGFTLIEAVITITIISILTAMMLPNYSHHLKRKNQAECDLAANKIYQSITNYMMTGLFRTKYMYPMIATKASDPGVVKNDFTEYEFLYVIEKMLMEAQMNVHGNYDYEDVDLSPDVRSGIVMIGLSFKEKEKINFYFEVFDYEDSEHDMAFLKYFDYFGTNGYQTTLYI